MINESNRRSVVLDLRCLQDPNYVGRGVGRHVLALLRNAPPSCRLVGLVDPALPHLAPEARDAVELAHINAYAASVAGTPRSPPACFVMLSPMTHDSIFTARLLTDPNVLKAAVVHDFIPHRLADQYLPGPADRLGYAIAMRWLARCDLFLPNSRSSATDLMSLLKVPESAIVVTGCSFDPAFETLGPLAANRQQRHVLVAGGGDPRKNPEVAIRAHARSQAMQDGAGVPLVVIGSYLEADAKKFRAIAAASGGRAALVKVPGHLPDAALLEFYSQALAVVSASHDEGFSIPLVEGMAAGIPCLASDIPAHAELVTDIDCRFPADDDVALRSKLERLLRDDTWRAAMLARQAGVWPKFRGPAVGKRFWDAVLGRLGSPAPAVLRKARPRVAMLSPVPPDRSGVADYTAATCTAFGELVELHVFTEAPAPAALRNVASIRPLEDLPHVSASFDRVVSVVGNSHFHLRIFEMLRRYGSACIAHDARMLGFYSVLLGRERALAVAEKELRRTVSATELNVWLGNEEKLEALFLGEIAESAAPTIVHSAITARMFPERYGVAAEYLPFSIYRPWAPEALAADRRAEARARLGLEQGEVAIVTFGFVQASKAPEECVWALETLRRWGIPASLHFVGALEVQANTAKLRPLVEELGLQRQVRFAEGYVSEQMYCDYLVGADLGVQLRTYGLGGLSGGLLDCAAAGIPTVTNASLGEAVGVPNYVRCIPDALSPLLLAEALANLLAEGLARQRPEAERQAFSRERSFSVYARKLCTTLAIETSWTNGTRAQAAQ